MNLITSLKQPEMDFPRRNDEPTLQYMLATSPRSGSTYVSLLLWESGNLGAPLEYLNFNHMGDLIDRLGGGDVCAYWRELRHVRTSPNGVFGFKMFLGHYALISESQPDLLPLVRADCVVFLSRRDKVAQAISNFRAAEGGSWFGDSKPRREVEYDFAKISSYLRYVHWQEEAWEEIFMKQGTQPLRIFYEDVVSDPANACVEVKYFVGAEPGSSAESVHLKLPRQQTDGLSLMWHKRFVEERAEQARAK